VNFAHGDLEIDVLQRANTREALLDSLHFQ